MDTAIAVWAGIVVMVLGSMVFVYVLTRPRNGEGHHHEEADSDSAEELYCPLVDKANLRIDKLERRLDRLEGLTPPATLGRPQTAYTSPTTAAQALISEGPPTAPETTPPAVGPLSWPNPGEWPPARTDGLSESG